MNQRHRLVIAAQQVAPVTLTSESFAGSYWTCSGTEDTSLPPVRTTGTWKVEPEFTGLPGGLNIEVHRLHGATRGGSAPTNRPD